MPNEDGAEDDGYDESESLPRLERFNPSPTSFSALVTVDTSYDPTSETYSRYIKDDVSHSLSGLSVRIRSSPWQLVRQLLVDVLPPGARLVVRTNTLL